MSILLSRDSFREAVFERDNHRCVTCGAPSQDAHHIIERRLFDDGGYYIDNGASLCGKCHILAEETTLSCEEIRSAAGIKNVILPYHMYDDNDYTYDKWGNIVLPNGQRLKGELFFDESVQKILAQGKVLNSFSKYIKYPRTMHLPWSEKLGKDDRVLENTNNFEGKEIIATAKLDGENTTFYRDYTHARSINSGSHPTRNQIKGIWARTGYEIPEGWRICGENMEGVHTIKYDNLESFFYVFSIWNEKNECLSWDDTIEWCTLLGLVMVPVLYRGIFEPDVLKMFNKSMYNGVQNEGYVVRLADTYKFSEFRKSVAKFVAKSFVIKHGHWTSGRIQTNSIGNDFIRK